MSVLVTGATGKTGKSLIAQLQAKGIACRAASRTAATPFDLVRTETWDAALEGVTSIYLVAPPTVDDPYSKIIDFLTSAMRSGPRRLVFLGMASLPAGGFAHGQVHQWLKDNSDDWAVLSPSAFMQNFTEGSHLATIRDEATFYSNTGTGRVPFISAEDIAAAAQAALTAPAPLNRDFTLTGDEAISYDRVAELISQASGRTISHTYITTEALVERFLARGLPELTARFLAAGYQTIADGAQAGVSEDFRTLTGRSPVSFQAFAQAKAGVWSPAS